MPVPAPKRRERRRVWFRQIKEAAPCTDCNTFYPYYVMQFDHRPEETKLFSFRHGDVMLYSQERIEAEIAKCDLVCANCHAIRTWNRMQESQKMDEITEMTA